MLPAKILSIYKKEIKIELNNGRRQRIDNGQYFKSEAEAEQYCYRLANDTWRKRCAEKILHDPPKQLLPNFQPRISGNPLRAAENNYEKRAAAAALLNQNY